MAQEEAVVIVRMEGNSFVQGREVTTFHGWLLCVLKSPSEGNEDILDQVTIYFPNKVAYEIIFRDEIYIRKWDDEGASEIIGRYSPSVGLTVVTDLVLSGDPESGAERKLAERSR